MACDNMLYAGLAGFFIVISIVLIMSIALIEDRVKILGIFIVAAFVLLLSSPLWLQIFTGVC